MYINPLARYPAGREVVSAHLAPDSYIPVHLTLPVCRFTCSAWLKVEEFIRHYIRWFVVRRFQAIGRIEKNLEKRQLPFRRGGHIRLTRCGNFKNWLEHLSQVCFNDNMQTECTVDFPVFRHVYEREFYKNF